MVLVLLVAAAGIAAAAGEAQSACIIVAIIVLNIALGFGQRYRAILTQPPSPPLGCQPAIRMQAELSKIAGLL